MALCKVLARQWPIKISVGGVLTAINGLDTLTFSNSKTDAPTTTRDENGRESHIVAARGSNIRFDGKYLVDPATGDRDPGQAAVDAAARLYGPDSLVEFSLTDPGGNVMTFNASVALNDVGGGMNDATSWGAELTVSGEIVYS
jgi:hypothetical protein